jgi:hypothetical protein
VLSGKPRMIILTSSSLTTGSVLELWNFMAVDYEACRVQIKTEDMHQPKHEGVSFI